MKNILFAFFLLTLAACSVFAQEKPVAFVGAKIIPVVGQPIENGILIVQNGKITSRFSDFGEVIRLRCSFPSRSQFPTQDLNDKLKIPFLSLKNFFKH